VLHELSGSIVNAQEPLKPFEHDLIARASAAEKLLTLAGVDSECLLEDGFFLVHLINLPAFTQTTLTRGDATLSHPMGEGKAEGVFIMAKDTSLQ
jgi:hypothetical protein